MHEHLERLEARLAAVLHGLSVQQAQLTPAAHPEKWSIQQIAEHLLLSYRSTTEVLRTRIEKGRPTQAGPRLGQRLGQFFLIRLGFFPPGRKAPAAVSPPLPASPLNGDELMLLVAGDLAALKNATEQAERLFGKKRCASHFVLGPLGVEQWEKFHLVHGLHHVRQIRQIRRSHGI